MPGGVTRRRPRGPQHDIVWGRSSFFANSGNRRASTSRRSPPALYRALSTRLPGTGGVSSGSRLQVSGGVGRRRLREEAVYCCRVLGSANLGHRVGVAQHAGNSRQGFEMIGTGPFGGKQQEH